MRADLARALGRTVPALGAAGALAVGAASLGAGLGSPLTSDDPHVVGWAAVVALAPSAVLWALARARGARAQRWAFGAPLAGLVAVVVYALRAAELHGGGVMLVVGAAAGLAAWPLWYVLTRWELSERVRVAAWGLAAAWALAWLASLLTRTGI